MKIIKRCLTLLCIISLTSVLPAYAASYTFTPKIVPGATSVATGINDAGTIIVGYYHNNTGPDVVHGYVWNKFYREGLDVPNSSWTQPLGINNSGTIAGHCVINGIMMGFTYKNATFSTFSAPNSSRTEVYGINNYGITVGIFNDSQGQHGFKYDGTTFTKIDVPGSTYTYATGINDNGKIVGYASGGPFVYDGIEFTYLVFPGTFFPRGINNDDKIVGCGYYSSPPEHAFIYANGKFTDLNNYFPQFSGRTPMSIAIDINNAGQIVGIYETLDSTNGFLLSPNYNAGSASYLLLLD